LPRLRRALHDLSWLLSHGYSERASLKLVGDRYRLQQRQRLAVARCAAPEALVALRREQSLGPEALAGRRVVIDGFNLLITLESALSGALLLEGADGCYRDLASIHGTYKRVIETNAAIDLAGRGLRELGVDGARWLLDRPVSNSGRLLTTLYEAAAAHGWNWRVDLLYNPDQELIRDGGIVITSDSAVLNQAASWFNFARYLIDRHLPDVRPLRLNH
jgi:hypothetical protein